MINKIERGISTGKRQENGAGVSESNGLNKEIVFYPPNDPFAVKFETKLWRTPHAELAQELALQLDVMADQLFYADRQYDNTSEVYCYVSTKLLQLISFLNTMANESEVLSSECVDQMILKIRNLLNRLTNKNFLPEDREMSLIENFYELEQAVDKIFANT